METLQLQPGYWRISASATKLYRCEDGTNGTAGACLGGAEAGDSSCRVGSVGPLCQICLDGSPPTRLDQNGSLQPVDPPNQTFWMYYDEDTAKCKECPLVFLLDSGVALTVVVFLSVSCVVAVVAWRVRKQASGIIILYAKLASDNMAVLRMFLVNMGLVAKAKVLIAFFQCLGPLPETYGITSALPGWYHETSKAWGFFRLDWLGSLVPNSCIGGFKNALAINVFAPLLLILGMMALGILKVTLDRCQAGEPGPPSIVEGVLLVTPQALATVFSFTISVSATIFSSWICEHYDEDSSAAIQQAYLTADLSVRCQTDGGGLDASDKTSIENYAIVYCAIWPIGMPLLYFTLLQRCGNAIKQNQITPLVKATALCAQ